MATKKAKSSGRATATRKRPTATGKRTTTASKRTTETRKRSTTGSARGASKEGSGKRLTDHSEIQEWAGSRGATPSCVRKTGGNGDVGMIRLDFPGYSGEQSLQEISWDEWFEKFDENQLALIVQDQTAGGAKSNFNKLVKRTAAEKKPRTRTAG